MTHFLRAISILLLIVGTLWLIFSTYPPTPSPSSKSTPESTHTKEYTRRTLTLADTSITVEIADTAEKRILGLSHRTALSPQSGMLFVFPEKDTHSIWMKDMRFSIDILWLDETGAIIHIEKHITPDTYPTLFTPPTPARFVLEVPAGFVDTHSIHMGESVEWE